MCGGETRLAGAAVRFAQGLFISAALVSGVGTAQARVPQSEIVTLGTMAGPMTNPERSQPATLLRWPGGMVLVDGGDVAVEQMSRAGIDPVSLRSVVITHIHADLSAGLLHCLPGAIS
jgi:glyoxylase-like metal-dependent hydrolase (beta-lactamase superfamily II)